MGKSDSDGYGGRGNYSQQDSQFSSASSGGSAGRYGDGNLARTNSSSTEVNRSDLFGGAQNRYAPDRGNAYASKSEGAQGDRYGNGNLARTNSSSTEVNRSDLFGGAQSRYGSGQGSAYGARQRPAQDGRFGQSGQSAVSGVDSGAYGGYGEQRELTEEEREEQQLEGTKDEIKQTREETLQSTNRTLQMMYQTVEVGQGTLAQLASQGERLQNAERNMDLAENYNAVGLDKAKELQTVNRSMFAVHVSNPFTAKKRAAARDQEVMDRHRMEKEARETTRRNHYQEAQTVAQSFRDMDINRDAPQSYSRVPREQNKYIFAEEGESEDEKEDAINRNLDEMGRVVGAIKGIATQTSVVLDQQIGVVDRLASKVRFVFCCSSFKIRF